MSERRIINGPHLRTERTTRWVMLQVTISLIPALLGAIYFWNPCVLRDRVFCGSLCTYRISLAEAHKNRLQQEISVQW